MDDRGARYIVGDPDDLYEIKAGEWYGWPDFASGIRLDDPHWGKDGQGRAPVLARFPNPQPPKPLVSFEPHAAANGISFSPSADFGFAGDAFVALFGDIAPVTTPRLAEPRGYKVVRVDMRSREIVDFAVNKVAGPASLLHHGGFERPSHCAFGPDGALYVVDYGKIQIAPEVGGVRMVLGTGALWRIYPTGGARGVRPPAPRRVPIYALQYGLPALAFGAAALYGAWRMLRKK
jgi:glucose/arabinose dehydrogenase